jgi:DMSO/TMAO reductase YedYZ heme-binding membrane subunit
MLTGVFIWIHVLALLFDSYMPFSLAAVIVPGAAPYRPLASALGVVAAELLLALAITNRYRKRLSHRFWRRVHYLNFAVWILSFAHGLWSGSDTGALWAQVVYLGAGATVAGLVVWRILNPMPAFAEKAV